MEHMSEGLPKLRKGALGRALSHEAIDYLADTARAGEAERTLVRALHNAFRLFSDWSAEHSIRVGMLVHTFHETLKGNRQESAQLGLCSCLHDIGKLAIPKQVLDKPGSLSEAERILIQAHTTEGPNCLDSLTSVDSEISNQVIRHHHENFDGTGYPDNLKGSDIPDHVQVARICDFYDALTFDRPYRPGLPRKESLDLMHKHIDWFNPDLFHFFRNEIDTIDVIDRRQPAAAE